MTLIFFVFQIQFEGTKRYTDKFGNTQFLVDPRNSRSIHAIQNEITIDGLKPDMKYEFNISAKFIDTQWGPPYTLTVQTEMDG